MAADGNTADDTITLRTIGTLSDISAADWNAHAHPEGTGHNPFISYEFLRLLEDSASTGAHAGWYASHLVLQRGDAIIGVAPAYQKAHSQGEYIFDHHWADAYERAGGRYYPKLLIASPFTPVPGPRLLCADPVHKPLLIQSVAQLTEQLGISSAHINFMPASDRTLLESHAFLPRIGEQFHWFNRDYQSFDAFLAALSSRKRKTIRQERRKVCEAGLRVENIAGPDITENHWDYFWDFYQDTGARKWGTPYLTRDAFSLLGQTMTSDIMLTLAFADTGERPVAGALHFVGSDALFGRYWGCTQEAKFLHFECCYYQAIEYAIDHGLSRVEAGAQGHHKLARGYEPVPTFSAHYIPDPGFREAISRYLEQERHGVAEEIAALKSFTPYKKTE